MESPECRRDLYSPGYPFTDIDGDGVNEMWVGGEAKYENGWTLYIRATYCDYA